MTYARYSRYSLCSFWTFKTNQQHIFMFIQAKSSKVAAENFSLASLAHKTGAKMEKINFNSTKTKLFCFLAWFNEWRKVRFMWVDHMLINYEISLSFIQRQNVSFHETWNMKTLKKFPEKFNKRKNIFEMRFFHDFEKSKLLNHHNDVPNFSLLLFVVEINTKNGIRHHEKRKKIINNIQHRNKMFWSIFFPSS